MTMTARKVAALTIAILIATVGHAFAQTTLQRCLGIVPGQEPTGVIKPSPATMQYCHQIPGWDLYDQAGQKFQAGDHAGAAQILTKASDAGNPVAELRLAMMYGTGDGVPHDLRRAFAYYKAAAESGEPAAQAELAGYYEYGDGVVQDNWDESAKWLRASAQQGWVKAAPMNLESGCRSISMTRSHGTTRPRPRATGKPNTLRNIFAIITEWTRARGIPKSRQCSGF